MKIGGFEFSRRELAGSMGDFGTLFPLAIGYIVINKMNPAGFLVMMGLTNIALGLIYQIPMTLEPKKVIAATAIAQKWPPSMIYSSGLALGAFWLILAFTGFIEHLVRVTPKCVVRGIQLTLGIMLARLGYNMLRPEWMWGLVAIVIALTLRTNKRAPAALVLILLGLAIVAYRGQLFGNLHLSLSLPPFTRPSFRDIYHAMILAGIAQIPLTLTNACIATCALLRDYFPQRPVTEKKLLINMGVMNVLVSFFGGMPMCHGSGGLAGQYYFGARTGGAPIMEGLMEIGVGIFLASSVADLLAAFPMGILGGMMILVGIELAKFTLDVQRREVGFVALTTGLSLLTNIGLGFLAGILAYHLWGWSSTRRRGRELRAGETG